MVGSFGTGNQLTTGFVLENQTLQPLVFPGSTYTIATGINYAGTVVGYFADSNSVEHGFLWTPPAGVATK
jgi:probable HAF family extracellular repeat protein